MKMMPGGDAYWCEKRRLDEAAAEQRRTAATGTHAADVVRGLARAAHAADVKRALMRP
jgi:hypothetical protein